mmetsp:Transcript_30413/g.52073  ORF Transcript_30413/g.52073 Transcript_30413/m.52073 type:complete len:87 (-) Transcript_30413:1726-1986(-)
MSEISKTSFEVLNTLPMLISKSSPNNPSKPSPANRADSSTIPEHIKRIAPPTSNNLNAEFKSSAELFLQPENKKVNCMPKKRGSIG